MYDSIFFVLHASQSSQTPLMEWGGSLTADAPPTWPPPPPVGFWPPSDLGYWCLPIQPYPGQPRGTPPPQSGQGYWRTGAAALWIASIEDTATSTYDFHATHCKTNVIM
jgi:hypothetical protein